MKQVLHCTSLILTFLFLPFVNHAQWVNISGTLSKISCATSTEVAGLDAQNNVYRLNTTVLAWDTIPASALKEISVTSNGTIWGVGPTINPTFNSNVYRFSNNSWSLPNNGAILAKISMQSDSLGYGVNPNFTDNVYRFNGSIWSLVSGSGSLKEISVGKTNSPWGIGPTINPTANSNVYLLNAANNTWSIPNSNISLSKISVQDSSKIIGLDANGNMYLRYSNNWNLITSISNVKEVSIGGDGTVYCLTNATSNNIFRSTWDSITNNSVGMAKLSETNFVKCFPNPATNDVTITSGISRIRKVDLFDIEGRMVYSQSVDFYNESLTIPINQLVDGFYYINVTLDNGLSNIVKLSKAK
jgi:hypothetical protein